jgi:hypothetical protein
MVITKPHSSSFETTPSAGPGEVVTFFHPDPGNPAWFFGRDPRGIDGYFPASWFRIDENRNQATASRSYDASELSVEPGDEVQILETHGDWVQVASPRGSGWIPEKCVRQSPPELASETQGPVG